MEKPLVFRSIKMPSDSIIHRNKLINDLLEMPSLSNSDFKKGLALREWTFAQDSASIRKEEEEQDVLAQQVRRETAREIFEEIGKKSHKAPAYSIVKNTDIKIPENPSMIVRDADWQSLQSKFLEGK